MPREKQPTIGALLSAFKSQKFKPEKLMQLKRRISVADEKKKKCRCCRQKNAIVGCLLCFDCATDALHASLQLS